MNKILFFCTDNVGHNDKCEYYDFIMDDLFSYYEFEEVHMQSFEEIINYDQHVDVFVYKCRDQQNHPWGYVPSYEDILTCVDKFKPKIVIQYGDEQYYEDLQNHNHIAKYCDLFLRQFNYSNYEYFNNTIHFPLGYYNKFNYKSKQIKKIEDRQLDWSFIGCEKSDRRECVDKFLKLKNNYIHLQQDGVPRQISRDELMDIYFDSIFSPCPRGWTQLEVNRIYESILCGSIPILTCSKDEFDVIFKYHNNPPFIFTNSWDESVEICSDLMNNKIKLQILQEKNIIWWKSTILSIRNEINQILTSKF